MKMWRLAVLKSGTGLLLIAIMFFSGLSLCQAEQQETRKELQVILHPREDCEKMSYLEFENILVDILMLERPAGADRLSETELFEVQAYMLAERGISLFVEAKPDALVTCSMLANVLYDALIGPSTESVEEKIEYLVGLGYIDFCVPSGILCASKIIDALNVSALSSAIAEGYSRPRGIARGRAGVEFLGIDPAPSNPAPETIIPKGRAPATAAPPPAIKASP